MVYLQISETQCERACDFRLCPVSHGQSRTRTLSAEPPKPTRRHLEHADTLKAPLSAMENCPGVTSISLLLTFGRRDEVRGHFPTSAVGIDPRLPANPTNKKKNSSHQEIAFCRGLFFLLFLLPTTHHLLSTKKAFTVARASVSQRTVPYVHEFCSRRVLSSEKHHKKNLKIHLEKNQT